MTRRGIKRQEQELVLRHKAVWLLIVGFGYFMTAYSLCDIFITSAEVEAAGIEWTVFNTALLYAKFLLGEAVGIYLVCVLPNQKKIRMATVSVVSWAIAIVGILLESIVKMILCIGKVVFYGIGYVNAETLEYAECMFQRFRIREERRKLLYEREVERDIERNRI